MVLPANEGQMEPIMGGSKKRVCYFFDSDIGNYHYGPGHPMKPTRIRMCHSLVMNYGLYKKMEIFRAKPATKREMSQFHTDDYVDFLYRITPDNASQLYAKDQVKYNVGDDCPLFEGLFEYCSISAGGSMEGAARLSRDKCDIAVNWAGGLHHAKKAEASGFCYVNDIVLGILELLRYHQRVLYIDIDVHHGDGVEEAFYTTDRVMTVSLHKYGEFFPGTGAQADNGIGKGKGYSVNVPLRDGVTDETYQDVFQSVIGRVVEWYKPGAIVLQCGADSLAGDKIGPFNMSLKGHAGCVEYVKKFNLPLLLLGGGGYSIHSVAKAWAYETGVAAGQKLGSAIPLSEYYEYFGPDYKLDVKPRTMEEMNTPEYIHKLKQSIFENMRDKDAAPGIQMQAVPKLAHDDDDDEDEDIADPDERNSTKQRDARIQNEHELSDSEDEGEGGRKHRQNHASRSPNGTRRRTPPAIANNDAAGPSKSATPAPAAPANGTVQASAPTSEDVDMDAPNVSATPAAGPQAEPQSTAPSQPAEPVPIFSRHSIMPINGVGLGDDVDPVPGGRPPSAPTAQATPSDSAVPPPDASA